MSVPRILILAADRKQSRVIFRYIAALLKQIPMLALLIENERAESFDLTTRVTIEVGTCSYRTVRGYTFAAVLCDELAFWRSDDSANPDDEIINAVRPGMATIPNAMLLCGSSPVRQARCALRYASKASRQGWSYRCLAGCHAHHEPDRAAGFHRYRNGKGSGISGAPNIWLNFAPTSRRSSPSRRYVPVWMPASSSGRTIASTPISPSRIRVVDHPTASSWSSLMSMAG